MEGIVNRRIAFFGGKPLSAQCLLHLYEYHKRGDVEIVAVLPRPKGQGGWWSRPGVPEMYDTAESLGLNIISSEQELKNYEVDLGYSVLYFNILKGDVINHARNGFLNLHGAALPHYRGCNSYTHAIMNGETTYGVTLHQIDEGVDSGPVITVKWFDLGPTATAKSLAEKAEQASYELFCETLPDILRGNYSPVPQKEIVERDGVNSRFYLRTSLAKEGIKEMATSWPAQKMYDYVRALEFPPFEPAYIMVDGKKIYLRTTFP